MRRVDCGDASLGLPWWRGREAYRLVVLCTEGEMVPPSSLGSRGLALGWRGDAALFFWSARRKW
jgi:hypothetical protein